MHAFTSPCGQVSLCAPELSKEIAALIARHESKEQEKVASLIDGSKETNQTNQLLDVKIE